MKSTIWITGSAGKIGSAMMRHLKGNVNYRVIGTNREIDVTDIKAVNKAMDNYKPDVVINCASLSDKNYCEGQMVEAFRVNALGARNLASATRQHNTKIIHLSSNEVFSGEHAMAKTEFDPPTPITVFGKSKLAGEQFVRELNPKHLIIRSSWVYGGKDDYVTEVLEKAKAGEAFNVPMDIISTPTSTELIADFIRTMLDKQEYGIYHASCEGACTKREYARSILYYAGYDIDLAKATFAVKDGLKVTTLLENLMMKMTGLYNMPEWQGELKKYIIKNKLRKEEH